MRREIKKRIRLPDRAETTGKEEDYGGRVTKAKGISMKKEKNLLESKVGRNTGFKVPEKYFERFAETMMEKLPEKQPEPEQKTTFWTLLRPWVYMAAMFVGIACMVRMFSWNADEKETSEELSLAWLSGNETYAEYVYDTSVDEYSVYECVYEDESSTFE